MLDRNKLNRVKGILSARQGAEVPKYQSGAKMAKKDAKGIYYYSDNGISWYYDPNLVYDYLDDVSQFQDVDLNEAIASANRQDIDDLKNLWSINQRKHYSQIAKNDTLLDPVVITAPKIQKTENTNSEEQDPESVKKAQTVKQKRAQTLNAAANTTTQVMQSVGQVLGSKQAATDSALTTGANAAYDQTADIVRQMNPVIGKLMDTASAVGNVVQELGGGTDQMTTTDQWMDSSFFSWNVGMVNGFGGSRADSFAVDQDVLASVGNSYGGTAADLASAASKSGKKYGLFSSSARKRANRQMAEARAKQNLMGSISDEATDQRLNAQSMGEQAGIAYSLMNDGGYNQKYTYAAKHGGSLEWVPVINTEWKPNIELNSDLSEFKTGGCVELVDKVVWIPEIKLGGKTKEINDSEIDTNQKNVIPEGALHKNKHHMEHAEGLTKKGIPVIDEDGAQQAEIEHSEIIFTLEVTKKLEEYYDIFYSDESTNKEKEQAALDAGKLLVYQILENTEDRSGLIDLCKQGGTLNLKDSIKNCNQKQEQSEQDYNDNEMKEIIKETLLELLSNAVK